jgi:hypothetical protein
MFLFAAKAGAMGLRPTETGAGKYQTFAVECDLIEP